MENKKIRYLISVSVIIMMIAGVLALPVINNDYSVQAATKKVKVIYKANGGKFTAAKYASKTTVVKKVRKGKKRGTAPKIKRTGYTLKGWYTKKSGGKKVTAKTKIKKRTVLYARWKKNASPVTDPNQKLIGHWTKGSFDSLGNYKYYHLYINKDGTFNYFMVTTAEYSYKGNYSASNGKIYFKNVVFTNGEYKENKEDSWVTYVLEPDSEGNELLKITNGNSFMGSPWWSRA